MKKYLKNFDHINIESSAIAKSLLLKKTNTNVDCVRYHVLRLFKVKFVLPPYSNTVLQFKNIEGCIGQGFVICGPSLILFCLTQVYFGFRINWPRICHLWTKFDLILLYPYLKTTIRNEDALAKDLSSVDQV
ncbi:Hypothetical protein CINCED_3A003391 [Cinara cedri]|uniref:Uncharacterized protein n=1 Tax=Cinara cedri TaxID=506608 RepID=A0A5E4NQU1_9HEMI|nr:Hypothetical protein CINCED_3A003391 [Cinara cedri]